MSPAPPAPFPEPPPDDSPVAVTPPDAAAAPATAPANDSMRDLFVRWLRRHETALWWLHSMYALAIGAGVVWIGARDFSLLRLAFAQIAFIWLTSRLLPVLLRGGLVPEAWEGRARLVVNYFNKNFYQQLLFFVLPVYWASVSLGTANTLFVVIVGISAVLATLDIVYDRYLSVRPPYLAVFFAFNLFACANVALPVLWHISNGRALRVAAALALAGFVTIRFSPRDLLHPRALVPVLITTVLLVSVVTLGSPLIPPAPLRVVSTEFGLGIARDGPVVQQRLTEARAGHHHRIYAVTAIYAPLGLADRLRHRWTAGGRVLYQSAYYTVEGGRDRGYRLWTSAPIDGLAAGTSIALVVETEGRQLVGRATIPVK